MFNSRYALISLVAAACFAVPAQAADAVFTATMDGAQCVPDSITTPATGVVELRASADGKKIDFKITVDKLLNPSQADLHLGPTGQNGQAVVKLWPQGGAAGKRGEFTGVLVEGSFDAGDFIGPLTGSSMADLLDEIRAGNTYVNVHTYDGTDPPYSGPGDYRIGEIRGQLK
jgi:CHRD domain